MEITRAEIALLNAKIENAHDIVKTICADLREDYKQYVTKQNAMNILIHDILMEQALIKKHLERMYGVCDWRL
jgi:hypothetical protein